jgi:ABC-type Fe3+/spermidine/putrescine transport system ATPase subunit
MDIHIEHLFKSFSGKVIIDDFSRQIASGSITFITGPSGCGKTTLLRIIAGLDSADVTVPPCQILFGQKNVTHVPVQERNVGFVFQNYALWPHMTVFENVSFSIRVKRSLNDHDISSVTDLLTQLGLGTLLKRYPHELSGGQQQRVALARTVLAKPNVLLLDEPFSNLDAAMRTDARNLIKEIHTRFSLTTLIVSHDSEDRDALATDEIKLKTL